MEILKSKKLLSEKQFFSFCQKKEKSFFIKSLIFNDLRGRGIVTKTGFKFGFDFRAYPKGRKMGEAHSEFVVQCFTQNQAFSLNELSRMVRMSQTLHTGLLLAIVDDDQNISYFKIDREMP